MTRWRRTTYLHRKNGRCLGVHSKISLHRAPRFEDVVRTAIGEAERRGQPLLWLQRSTRRSQGDHAIVTFSKPRPPRAANGSCSRHACRVTSTGTEVEQGCEGEHIFRKLVCRTGGIQVHHIHERCMGLRQEWHWECRGIVDHEGDEERRDKVHGFFGEFHVPAAQMPSNPQDHSPIVSQMLEEFPASFLMK